MPRIALTRGRYAIVDIEDLPMIAEYSRWFFDGRYAKAVKNNRSLHSLIVDPPKGYDVDHINGDKLDNRRSNLRICTRSQNLSNTIKRRNNTSGYKGVYKHNDRWVAEIWLRGKKIYLGRFVNIEDAAKAYREAAIQYHREFAKW